MPGQGDIIPRSVLRRAEIMTDDQLLNTSKARGVGGESQRSTTAARRTARRVGVNGGILSLQVKRRFTRCAKTLMPSAS